MILALDEIRIGERVRKDMGDLRSLAESMSRHGLLHPVVVKKDHTLVAGHRRIEAARLLGLTDIDVTVVDVEDLLSAERDENEVRKDFTPTEAVAIGRLIEEVERPKAIERKRLSGVKAHALQRINRGEGETPVPHIERAQVREVVGRAVGMGGRQYEAAKAVVNAAEADPERFGDLPAQMDETGNVSAAHRELQRRNGTKPKERHPVHKKTHYPKPNQEIQRAVLALEGICFALESLEIDRLDPAQTKGWAESLKASALFLGRLSRKVRVVKAA